MSGLLEWQQKRKLEQEAPLAARMRPRTLDEFVGQHHIIGPGRLLRRAIEADQLTSLIFYGPPGTGKTTLARIVANTTQAHFISVNAVLAGVKDLRKAIEVARDRLQNWDQRTILFVDEVHRFNKSQQDALLPWVENGMVVLIGATTENPYFEVNKALVSRSRVFQLKALDAEALRQLAQRALADKERGYGERVVKIDENAIEHLVNIANGDGRVLLGALELAVETTRPASDGRIYITLSVAEESIQQRAVLYDKEGDTHFDTISAFIKSVRGSDPDAALYWLARMVYAGEDPRFIFRRLLILASEDVGMADPSAISVVAACATTFDRIGMPEGRFPLAQATLRLATAPKSNSTFGFFDALTAVADEQEHEVPNHLKDPSRDKKGFGHGVGYLYPHAYRDHWVTQQYLPSSLQGRVFYQPSKQGFEAQIHDAVAANREAQLAAMVEGISLAPPEILTWSPEDPRSARWLQRTLSTAGERLADIRTQLFDKTRIERHHIVLDLHASAGLLTWEALRRAPEGCVVAIARDQNDADALTEQALVLTELARPVVVHLEAPHDLTTALNNHLPDVRLDCIVGRNVLATATDRTVEAHSIAAIMTPDTRLVLAETIPRQTQRIYQLVDTDALEPPLMERWQQAEEALYQHSDNPMVAWDADDLTQALTQAGLTISQQTQRMTTRIQMTRPLIDRWFAASSERPTYAKRLSNLLTSDELTRIHTVLSSKLTGSEVEWGSTVVFMEGRRQRNTELH